MFSIQSEIQYLKKIYFTNNEDKLGILLSIFPKLSTYLNDCPYECH